jgi:hypothetical protein
VGNLSGAQPCCRPMRRDAHVSSDLSLKRIVNKAVYTFLARGRRIGVYEDDAAPVEASVSGPRVWSILRGLTRVGHIVSASTMPSDMSMCQSTARGGAGPRAGELRWRYRHIAADHRRLNGWRPP